jgi:AAHS family 4-hydroxybenzoate transporter-like MFS transporter
MPTVTMGKLEEDTIAPARRPLLVLLICAIAGAFDGFDTQALGFVVPLLTKQWGVGLPAFGIVFSVGLAGMIAGAVLLAPLSDRTGRKALVVGSMILAGLPTIATALATNVEEIAVLRFIAGLGFGGITATVVSIAHEAPEAKYRPLYVTVVMCGFPLGGFLGGLIAAWSLPRHGWENLFIGLGIAALLIAVALMMILENRKPEARKIRVPSLSVVVLFRHGNASATVMIWLQFLVTLIITYLVTSWLPSLIQRGGFSVSQAAFASGMLNLGAVFGGLMMGFLFSRIGQMVVVIGYVSIAAMLAGMGFVTTDLMLILAVCFLIGFFNLGTYAANNVTVAMQYPAAMRATGVGWAQGVGRAGSILAPSLTAMALQFGWSNRDIFLSAALLAIVGSLAAFALAVHQWRSPARAVK